MEVPFKDEIFAIPKGATAPPNFSKTTGEQPLSAFFLSLFTRPQG
jgi:hypothetical protein